MAATNSKLACLDCQLPYSIKLSEECDKPADFCPMCGGQNLGDVAALESAADPLDDDEG